jgi:hypothetical protein
MFDSEDILFLLIVALVIAVACAGISVLSSVKNPACVTHFEQVIYVDDLETYPKSSKVSYKYDGTEYYSNQATYWYVEKGESCGQ